MERKGIALILVFIAIFASVSFAVEKIVYFDLEEGYPYYCNPCWVTYSNSTHSLKGQTNRSSYFFIFNGTSSTYTISSKMQMIGFNISADDVEMTGNSVHVNTGLYRRGNIAFITNGGTSNDFYPFTSNNEGSYSYDLLFNIIRALGYDSMNNLNNYSHYDLSDTVASNAFNSYDTIVLAGQGTPSFAISTAVQNAEANGIKVIANLYTVSQSSMTISGLVNYTFNSLTGSGGYMYGAVVDAFHPYPNGYVTQENIYYDVRSVVGNTGASERRWHTDSGTASYIDYGLYNYRATTASWNKPQHPMFSRYDDYYLVVAGQYNGASSVAHSPTLKSLMYLTLLNYDLGVDSKPIAFNVLTNPLLPGNETNLTCSYNYYDYDGDPESNVFYRWYVNDTIIDWDNSTLTSNNTDVGDVIRCAVRVNNSEGIGDWTQSSNNVTILSNAGPLAENVLITPATPYSDNNLVCSYSYYDTEGDLENSSTFRWFKNEVSLGITSQTLLSANTAVGDIIVCEVTPKAFTGTKTGTPVNSSNATILERTYTDPPSSGGGGGIPPSEEDEEILCTNECPPDFIRLDYSHGCSCVQDTTCTNECPYNLRLDASNGCACVADLFCINSCPPGKFRTNYPECACVDQIVEGEDFKITPVYDDIFLGEIPLPCQVFGEVCCNYVLTNIANNEINVRFSSEIPRYDENIVIRTSEGGVDSIGLSEAEQIEFSLCVQNLIPGESFNTDLIAESGRAIKRINVYSNPPLLLTSYGGFPFWGWIVLFIVIPLILALIWYLFFRKKKRGMRRGSKSYNVFYKAPNVGSDDTFMVLILAFVVIIILAIIMFI